MSRITLNDYIRCHFRLCKSSLSNYPVPEVEVYYGLTAELNSICSDLEKNLSAEERSKAGRFKFLEDRETYILSHGLLRLILSGKLRKRPLELIIYTDKNNKPAIDGQPLHFNITHTRKAFAIVVSKDSYAGVDMEDTDQSLDFRDLLEPYFSKKESSYILESEASARNRFFLLWTRKEALLKALGTGIVQDINKIELLNKQNLIDRKIFDSYLCHPVNNEHFIYSELILNICLSVAIPRRSRITIEKIGEGTIFSMQE